MSELRDFQRRVVAKLNELRHRDPYTVDQARRDLGLEGFVDDQVVTVKVTVPAADAETAKGAVEAQVRGIYLPAGWSTEVTV